MTDSKSVKLAFDCVGGDFERAGEASSKIKKMLQRLGIPADIVRRIAIGTYEAEMNVIMYAKTATLDFIITSDEVIITIEDEGPGIENIELAMQEGYSTATSEIREMGFVAGLGLPNIKNNSDEFKIDTEILKGTKLYIKIYLN